MFRFFERTTRSLSVLLAALAASAVLALAPHAAHADGAPTVGVVFHGMWNYANDSERTTTLDQMAAAGLTWIRFDISWQDLTVDGKGTYDPDYVKTMDFVVDQARARGMNVLVMMWGTPPWATTLSAADYDDLDGYRYPPTNAAEYGDAANWVVNHLKGRIQAFEVWNEPNGSSYWTGTAAQYATLLKAAYPKIKAADPSVTVVSGGVDYNDNAWLTQMYAGGAKDSFDVLATHPYMSPSNLTPETDNGTIWTIAGVKAVRSLMVTNGDGAKDIWFTEMGWSSHSNTGTESNWRIGVTEAQQADYIVRALKYITANFPYVKNTFVYNARSRSTTDPHQANFGLLYRNMTPKPAYTSLKDYLANPGSGGTGGTGGTGTTTGPTTTISRSKDGASYSRTKLTVLRGNASDDGSIEQVDVSLRRKRTDGSCRWWNGSGWTNQACGSKIWVAASGTGSWSYTLSKLLGRSNGTKTKNYRLYARTTDANGNVESSFSRGRNSNVFEVV